MECVTALAFIGATAIDKIPSQTIHECYNGEIYINITCENFGKHINDLKCVSAQGQRRHFSNHKTAITVPFGPKTLRFSNNNHRNQQKNKFKNNFFCVTTNNIVMQQFQQFYSDKKKYWNNKAFIHSFRANGGNWIVTPASFALPIYGA